MVKMIVRDEKREPETVIEWWLEQDRDMVLLKARSSGEPCIDQVVFVLSGDGARPLTLGKGFPLQRDSLGRIKVTQP